MNKKTIELKVPEIGPGTVCIACLLFLSIVLLTVLGWEGFMAIVFTMAVTAAIVGAIISFVEWLRT